MAPKVTVPQVRSRKRARGAEPLVMLTAYDTPGARIADAAGVDMILVGDSVANTVLGHADTLQVDVGVMAHHVGAVARAKPRALVVGDLPWLSYHVSVEDTIRNGATLVRAGAEAVKLEGGRARVPMIEALVATEIPVWAISGSPPSRCTPWAATRSRPGPRPRPTPWSTTPRPSPRRDASPSSSRGCPTWWPPGSPPRWTCPPSGSVPGRPATARSWCSTTFSGLGDGPVPKFVRRYADLASLAVEAVSAWAADVRSGAFPSDAETYHLPPEPGPGGR